MRLFLWLFSAEYRQRRTRILERRTVPVRTRRIGKVLRDVYAGGQASSVMTSPFISLTVAHIPAATGKQIRFIAR